MPKRAIDNTRIHFASEVGATSVEYGILVVLIVAAIVLATVALGNFL
jgi:Flp pilus assembly pilin Flp